MAQFRTKQAAAPGVTRSRILAIDYGRRRIGLALSDELRLTARPLATLVRTNRRNDIRRIRELAREHAVALIIVGHPLHLSGAAGPMAEEAARFAARIRKELALPVELADERLSSWEAGEVLEQTAARRKGEAADDVAAAVILRDYLRRVAGKKAAAATADKD
jgi:putative Holliday junction resolvase